jgi:hypothetical protein
MHTSELRECFRQPEVLRELWSALGGDPFLIAEVIARPALVDRLARSSFDADEKTTQAEARGAGAATASFDAWWDGAGQQFAAAPAANEEFDYQLAEVNNAGADDTWQPTQALPVATCTAGWPGTEMIVWGVGTSYGVRTNSGPRNNLATDT